MTVQAPRVILDERGGASILMAGVMGVVVTISWVAMLISGYLLGYHRARAAADLAALSGAVAYQQGRNGCVEARRLAAANGARLADCGQVGDQVDFVITVRAAVAVETESAGPAQDDHGRGARRPGGPSRVHRGRHPPVALRSRRVHVRVVLRLEYRANSPRDHRVS